LRRVAALIGLILALGMAALAQDTSPGETSDNGFIIDFLQNRISAPGRQIRVHGVTGALSSRARIGEVTIADETGIWLRLVGVEMDWSRSQLLLGRVAVNRLAVERIDMLRRPVPPRRRLADRLPKVEAQPFRLPELPVSVRIAALDLPSIVLAEPVLGQAATLAVAGSADLARGELDATLDARRLDGVGGALGLSLDFSNATRALSLDLTLQEPENGVVATLLDIEGRPAIDVAVQGEGPLDALDVNFTFDAGDARIAAGLVSLRSAPDGSAFAADFRGGLAPVAPAAYREFFAGETSVEAAGVALSAGGFRLDRLAISGAALDLTGALQTAPDGFPRNLTLSGRIGDPRGPAVTLPVPGAATRINSAILHLSYGEGRRWSGLLALDRLEAADIEIEDLTLTLGGRAENLDDPARRDVTIAVEGVATGIWSEDEDVRAALGTRLDLFADAALPAGGPLSIRQAQVSGRDMSVFASGVLRGLAFDGRLAARLADIAPASGLAGCDLGGSLDFVADGAVDPVSGAFDLALDGSALDLRLGDPRLDGLLQGETTLRGRVARDEAGIRTDGFRLANPRVEIASTGRIAASSADLAIEARIADLAVVAPQASGALEARGSVRGSGRPFDVSFTAEVPRGRLIGHELEGARLAFDGLVDGPNVSGDVSGSGRLGDQPLALAAELALAGPERALRALRAEVGPNRITGDVSMNGDGPILGEIAIDAPDLTPLAALALTEATGSARATVRFAPATIGQGVSVDASARRVTVGSASIGSLDLAAEVVDALAAPLVDGTLAASDVNAAGLQVSTLSARADQTAPNAMEVAASARLAVGTEIDTSGSLTRLDGGGFEARVDTLSMRQQEIEARLAAPATVTVAGGDLRLTPVVLNLGEGVLTARGEIGESFDLDLLIGRLPLELANAVAPGLGFGGTLQGSARVTGSRDAPDVRFDLTGDGLVSAQTAVAGLPPLRLRAAGQTESGRLQLDAEIAAQGLDARLAGAVPLGQGPLELDVTLASFPLALIDRLAGHRGLAGTVTGTAQVRGSTRAPTATFDLRGTEIAAQPMRDIGLAPLTVTGRGSFVRNVLTLEAAEATNAQGLGVTASGRVPLAGPGLDVRATGAAPLAIANALLEERTAQATGLLRFDLHASGAVNAPRLAGSANLEGGTFIDPQTNVRLQDIGLAASFDGQTVTLQRLRATAAQGGEITASGTISLAAGNPADLEANFNGVRYTDGSFASTTIDGRLRLRGPATGGGGVISGRIDLGRTEISVAEGLGGPTLQTLQEVRHVNTPAGVQQTLDRARVGEPNPPQPSGRRGLVADVRINAPNQIFVRGRGLDVELGGALTLTGPIDDIAPVGQFDMRRGRLDILGQRITFDEGSLRLIGNYDPEINFVARTSHGGVTAIVTVTGRVSAPDIQFSSQPPLPQDEVLARLIFNQPVNRLSPFQIAQLAAAAAELAGGGGGGPGILEHLRSATGFDDLDIVTADDGETAVRAGRYIDDNIYVDVEAEASGDTRAQINLDITDDLSIRGSVATDGNTGLGIFFERDY